MSYIEISKLYENLTLVDEDEVVLEMAEKVELEGVEDVDRCLVGKVLSGKKVNRESFKGLIEQIWNPYGNVEVELVDDNIFLFHFPNQEDRNRVWFRGPWYFGNSLIVLEKLMGSGHCIKECQDEEARSAAIKGSQNKYGSWLKAPIPDRSRSRFGSHVNGSSLDRTGSIEASRESEGSFLEQDGYRQAEACIEQCVQNLGLSLSESIVSPPIKTTVSPPTKITAQVSHHQDQLKTVAHSISSAQSLLETTSLITKPVVPAILKLSPKKKITKRWKRSAPEAKQKQIPMLISNPLQRILEFSGSPRRSPKKKINKVCKRKVSFDLMDENERSPKKGKCSISISENTKSAEPEAQLKLNSAAVICKGSDTIGIGSAIWDYKGKAQQNCINCGVCMGKYFYAKCNFFDDDLVEMTFMRLYNRLWKGRRYGVNENLNVIHKSSTALRTVLYDDDGIESFRIRLCCGVLHLAPSCCCSNYRSFRRILEAVESNACTTFLIPLFLTPPDSAAVDFAATITALHRPNNLLNLLAAQKGFDLFGSHSHRSQVTRWVFFKANRRIVKLAYGCALG
ncbi:hypothetical protein EZV62_011190 [Acer yangbiense]|uniref:DUF4283 domain-containing protein n=1 Tax=Acer yangbiense TaxID=1000413 RepID=A0A5C7I6Q4_9ROSI|nr:hypothetical protein EZV62_011190 [Acer yangbiense]